jgi:hypothetical protein
MALVLVAGVRLARASEHPGNVFVRGESVRVSVPTTWAGWRAVDVDGNELASGTDGARTADLGALPIGYYEVLEKDGPGKVTAAVVAKVVPVDDTPIALDAAMSWFYSDPEQIRGASQLCRLAGVKWVRDRLSWPEIETARGTWAEEGRYERAMRIEHEAGLKVLQVNHISPAWATHNATGFPDDLRDVYNFYRGLAQRWGELADAIEPWNEPDIPLFGGHTGCEIASFQKAAYLGLKAGNPQQPVCGTCFAIDRAKTLEEFGENEVYPYFDRYDLHHYIRLPDYQRAYARHRAVSGGRPLWTTEFNLPVWWADEITKEPSDEELRVQGYRVGKVFAHALYEGAEKAFYFILGHYVERNLQYGLVHGDLTPRPAYVAFAAVGRLLNGAKPLGRVDLGDDLLKAYAFRTQVDGADHETLVAWSETMPTQIEMPSAEKAFDYLGRELPTGRQVQLSRATVFMLLPPGGSQELSIAPPPKKADWRSATPCPVVLQLLGKGDVKLSAFRLDDRKEIRLVTYNFGDRMAQGTLQLQGARTDAAKIEVMPGGRDERVIAVDGSRTVRVQLNLEKNGQPVVSGHVTGMASE